MKRNKIPEVIDLNSIQGVQAIFYSDPHFKEESPPCFESDFQAAQFKKIEWLKGLQQKFKVPVICAGDLFHKWKNSPGFLTQMIDALDWHDKGPEMLGHYVIPGNHDLPSHSLELFEKSSLSVMRAAERVGVLNGDFRYCYNSTAPLSYQLSGYENESFQFWITALAFGEFDLKKGGIAQGIIDGMPAKDTVFPHVLMIHYLTDSSNAEQVLEYVRSLTNTRVDLIVSGDNHKGFILDELLVPGSFQRISADQIDDQPKIYLWTPSGERKLIPIPVPCDGEVISREHIEVEAEVEKRLSQFAESFVSRLEVTAEIGLDFRGMLQKFFRENTVDEAIEKIVWKCTEGKIN